MPDARDWITTLNLEPHPEGGWYKETYRAELSIPHSALPPAFGGDRAVATSIYYLLEAHDVSRFHRIQSDETWHHYAGDPVTIHMPGNTPDQVRIGSIPGLTTPQFTVPAGIWFGAELESDSGFALMGCTVAPGFDFSEFELADQADLCARYPRHEPLIRRLTQA